MTENKHITKIVYALVAVALAAMILISNVVKGMTVDEGMTQDYESSLFDTSSVMTVDILMDEDEWQELLDNAINEQYMACSIVINGETFYNVGIRAKGNTSLTNIVNDDDCDRYSFKIKFDEYVKGQTCHGLDKLVLNNNYADATNMKEALIYDMFAYLNADASLYTYSKISVNGEYIGVYTALEGVEDSFMLRNYGTKNGELYKPENMGFGDGPSDKRKDPPKRENTEDGSEAQDMQEGFNPGNNGKFPDRGGFNRTLDHKDSASQNEGLAVKTGSSRQGGPLLSSFEGGPGGFGSGGGSNLEYTDDDLDSYSTIWDGEVTSTSKSDHKRVVKALKAIAEGDLSTIEEYMDIDNLLKYMAVHEFAVNDDSLSGNMAHNYYLYESEGQLNIIPWDYNLSFGGMFDGGPGGGPEGDKNLSAGATSMINDPIDDSWQSTNFFDILLENEEYNAKYHEYLQMLVDYVENGEYKKLTDRIHSQIDELVKTDPTAFYTYDEYTAAYEMLDEVVALRAESIKGQLDGNIPSTSEGQKEDSSSLIDGSNIDTSVMGRMGGGAPSH